MAQEFDPPTVAQAIEVLVRYRPGLTRTRIARAIFGREKTTIFGSRNKGYEQRVAQPITLLEEHGYIKSDGRRPARYFSGRTGPAGGGLT